MLRSCSLFLLLILLFPLPLAAAQQETHSEATAALAKDYPHIPVKEVNPTPIDGVFEVVTKKDEIIYFAPRTGNLLIGELWSHDGHNLTRETHDRLMSGKVSLLPLDKAIKIGNGPNQVVEISDPDCPFCRDGSAFFATRHDVTRYVFFYPLTKIHPHSAAKARFILSAKNPAEAYEEVFSGAYDDKPLPKFKDNGLFDVQQQIIKRIGIHSTPHYWINGHYVSGANPKKFEQLLAHK